MRRPRVCVAAVFATSLLLASAGGLAGEPERPTPRSMRQLKGMLRECLEDTRIPGLAWAVVEPDGSVEAAGVGLADVASLARAGGIHLRRSGYGVVSGRVLPGDDPWQDHISQDSDPARGAWTVCNLCRLRSAEPLPFRPPA